MVRPLVLSGALLRASALLSLGMALSALVQSTCLLKKPPNMVFVGRTVQNPLPRRLGAVNAACPLLVKPIRLSKKLGMPPRLQPLVPLPTNVASRPTVFVLILMTGTLRCVPVPTPLVTPTVLVLPPTKVT